jgi:tetratricopeptide (TPR) repeat protein
MALAHRSLNEFEPAVACFQEALTFYQRHGVADRIAFAETGIGDLHHKMGRPRAALESLGRALAIYRRLGARQPVQLLEHEIAAIEESLENQGSPPDSP